MNLEILYEDNHLLAVNKPGGVLVQGDASGDVPLVEHAKFYLSEKYEKKGAVFLGVVHRIDRPVSGIVLFARTSKALGRMNALFRDRNVTKTYWALVEGEPVAPEGKLVHWLRKNEARNKTTVFTRETENALRSELTYRKKQQVGTDWLLEVNPVTGRSHQIRAQLSAMGCPIKGDLKYGASQAAEDGTIALHARELSFVHPVRKEPVHLVAPVPDSLFWKQVKYVN